MKRLLGLILGVMLVGACGAPDGNAYGMDASAVDGRDGGAGAARGMKDAETPARGMKDAETPRADGDGGTTMSDAGAEDSAAARDSDLPAQDAADTGSTGQDGNAGDAGDAGGGGPARCVPVVIDDAVLAARTLPALAVDDVLLDRDGVAYVYSSAAGELHRWSATTESALGVVDLGPGSTHVAYSAVNGRIYVAYTDGKIRQIDVATLAMTDFVVVAARPHGLVAGGAFVMVADASGSWATHRSFAADGSPISAVEWNYQSKDYGFSEELGMLYFLRVDVYPNAFMREPFDPATGVIGGGGSPGIPLQAALRLEPDYPIVASTDGDHVVLGTGDVFSGTLVYQGSLPRTIRAALWRPDGDLVTLAEEGGATLVERWNELWHRKTVERLIGTPLYLLQHGSQVWAVVDVEGRPRFVPTALGSDGDCDGVDYEDDLFPTDPAAAGDVDYDGFPDAWNPGRTVADSTTGLTLDAFPNDSACHLPAQGVGGDPNAACDILKSLDWSSFIPAFGHIDKRGVVYLFRTNSAQVGRWDSATGTALNPLILSGPPVSAAYSNERDRLYVAQRAGTVVQFAPATSVRPQPFAFAHQLVRDVIDAAGLVIVASEEASGGQSAFVSYAPSGAVMAHRNLGGPPYGPAYSPARDRLYFLDLGGQYIDVDPATGRFVAESLPGRNIDLQLSAPIQFSDNGAELFFGTGAVTNADVTKLLRSFPAAAKFLVTTPNRLMTISSSYPNTRVQRYFLGVAGGTDLLLGAPHLLLDAGAKALVVTIVPANPDTIGRDPPTFHFVDHWKEPE